MIRVTSEDGESAVDLLGENDAGKFVRHGHGTEREELRGAFAGVIGPAVGWADGEDDELAAFVALAPEPPGEGLRCHLLTALVEEDEHGGGASALVFDCLPESLFGAETWRVDAGLARKKRPDAIEVHVRQLVESLARTRSDGGNSDLHALSVREVRFRHENCATRAPGRPSSPVILIKAIPLGMASNLNGAMV